MAETAGEFRIVMGRETVQTQSIWKTQKPRKGRNLLRLSSKRSSLPVCEGAVVSVMGWKC